MGLSLKDVVYQARMWLGEPDPFYWQDYQVVVACNNALQEMASIAGGLTKYDEVVLNTITTNVPSNGTVIQLQEAALDAEVDSVKSCKYYSGQEFVLAYADWKSLQTGASTGSIPQYYYLKTDTRQLTPMSTANSQILPFNIGPNMPGGETYRTVIGAWPVPQFPAPATLQVWYSYFHPFVQDPTDPINIPRRFLRGLVHGTVLYCLMTEKALGEVEYHDQQFKAYSEMFRVYQGRQKQSDRPPRYGPILEPWRQNASSSVILVDPYPKM